MIWSLLQSPVAMKLTFVLLHFLWQAILLVCLWRVAAALLPLRSAEARYNGALATLLLMLACPLVTFMLVDVHDISSTTELPLAVSSSAANPELSLNSNAMPDLAAEQAISPEIAQAAVINDQAAQLTPTAILLASQPYLMLTWLVGVLLLGTRICVSYLGTVWLRKAGLTCVDPTVLVRFAEIAQRLNIAQLPPIAYSSRITQAMTVGLMRPMVLLPMAWATEISPDVLEAVLAHELAHVRRSDLWINFLQRVMETIFFYHPAVWILSAEVRRERESCCDELAIRATGQRLDYAKSLHEVAYRQMASQAPSLAIPFLGQRPGELLGRVRRILGITTPQAGERSWPAGLMLMIVPLFLWAISAIFFPEISAKAEAEEAPSQEVTKVEEVIEEDEIFLPPPHHRRGRPHPPHAPIHPPHPPGEPGRRPARDHLPPPRGAVVGEDRPAPPLNQIDMDELAPHDQAMVRVLRSLRHEVRQLRDQVQELKEEQEQETELQANAPRRRKRARRVEVMETTESDMTALDETD